MIRSTLPTPVRHAPLLAVAGALVLLAGCGGTDGAKTVTVGAGATRPAGSASPATKADRASGPRPEPAVMASRTGTVNDEPVLLQIVGLRRSGRTVSLSLRLTTKSDVYVFIDDTFDDGIAEKSRSPGVDASAGTDSVDGIYLVDGQNGRRYLAGRDADNNCACDVSLDGERVRPDAPMNLSAIFGAPPPSVKVVDVFIPRFGTFKDLPLG